MPLTGRIKPEIVALFSLTNIGSRSLESSACKVDSKHEIAHHHHEIVADYVVSLGIAGITYGLAKNNPAMAKYVVSTFFATNVLYAGEQAPIDFLKMGITDSLDWLLGDIW